MDKRLFLKLTFIFLLSLTILGNFTGNNRQIPRDHSYSQVKDENIPLIQGEFNNIHVIDFDIMNNYLYTLDLDNGLNIYIKKDNNNCELIHNEGNINNPVSLIVLGDYIIVMEETKLNAYFQSQNTLQLVFELVLPSNSQDSYATDFAINGNFGYISINGTAPKLLILDLADPTNISIIKEIVIDEIGTAISPNQLIVNGNHLYIGSQEGIINIYDIGNRLNPLFLIQHIFDSPMKIFENNDYNNNNNNKKKTIMTIIFW